MTVHVALHTRLAPGAEEAYEAAHCEVPAELLERVHSYGDADAGLDVVWEL